MVCTLLRENQSQIITWSKMLFPMLFTQLLNRKKKYLMMRQPQTSFNWMMNKNRFLWQLKLTMLWISNPGPSISSSIKKRSPSKTKRSLTLTIKLRLISRSKRLKMLRNKPFANSTL